MADLQKQNNTTQHQQHVDNIPSKVVIMKNINQDEQTTNLRLNPKQIVIQTTQSNNQEAATQSIAYELLNAPAFYNLAQLQSLVSTVEGDPKTVFVNDVCVAKQPEIYVVANEDCSTSTVTSNGVIKETSEAGRVPIESQEAWNDMFQITINKDGQLEINNVGNSMENTSQTPSNSQNTENFQSIECQTTNNTYKCMVYNCNKNLKSYKELVEHRKSHQKVKEYQCTFENCPWSFDTQYRLNRHMRSHEQIKNFVCPYAMCNKVFSTSYNLKVHAKCHLENKDNIKCNHCGKQYFDKRKLGNHIRKTHLAEPLFECTICDKKVHTAAALKMHIKSHSLKRMFECPYNGCDKKFTKNSRLKEHLYYHTGERPFKCDKCEWGFTNNALLKRHKKVHCNNNRLKKVLKPPENEVTVMNDVSQIQTTKDGDSVFYICPFEGCGALFESHTGAKEHISQMHVMREQDFSDPKEKSIEVSEVTAECSTGQPSTQYISTIEQPDVNTECIAMDEIFLTTHDTDEATELAYTNVDPAEFFNGITEAYHTVGSELKANDTIESTASTSSADVYFNLSECVTSVDPNIVMSLHKEASPSFEGMGQIQSSSDLTIQNYVSNQITVNSESTINLNDIT